MIFGTKTRKFKVVDVVIDPTLAEKMRPHQRDGVKVGLSVVFLAKHASLYPDLNCTAAVYVRMCNGSTYRGEWRYFG